MIMLEGAFNDGSIDINPNSLSVEFAVLKLASVWFAIFPYRPSKPMFVAILKFTLVQVPAVFTDEPTDSVHLPLFIELPRIDLVHSNLLVCFDL